MDLVCDLAAGPRQAETDRQSRLDFENSSLLLQPLAPVGQRLLVLLREAETEPRAHYVGQLAG
jgi:hypothetical protein